MKIMYCSLLLLTAPLMSMEPESTSQEFEKITSQQKELPSTLIHRKKASELSPEWKNFFVGNAIEEKDPKALKELFEEFYETSENIFVEQTENNITLSEKEIEALKKIDQASLEVYEQQAIKIIMNEIKEYETAVRFLRSGIFLLLTGACTHQPLAAGAGIAFLGYGMIRDYNNASQFHLPVKILRSLQTAAKNRAFFAKEKTE
ncbi:MAG: hypothetical protein AB7R69_03550 [Candidatus Babeliales bacterium]